MEPMPSPGKATTGGTYAELTCMIVWEMNYNIKELNKNIMRLEVRLNDIIAVLKKK